MASTSQSGSGSMTLERLRTLLDAYGASPERWPPAERERALVLLAESTEARRLRDAARGLDALLDLVPARQPSPVLVERTLAGAPAGRRHRRHRYARRWRIAAALVPLAAAAAAALWLLPQRTPAPAEPVRYAIEDLGVYTTPTDVLLQALGVDVLRSAPVLGCVNNGLACPIADVAAERHSLSHHRERRYA